WRFFCLKLGRPSLARSGGTRCDNCQLPAIVCCFINAAICNAEKAERIPADSWKRLAPIHFSRDIFSFSFYFMVRIVKLYISGELSCSRHTATDLCLFGNIFLFS